MYSYLVHFYFIIVNVALQKKAWRHPDDMVGFEAKLATDGKLDFTLSSMSCTQASAGTDPWFVVDLERKVLIFEVKVLNTDTNRKIIFSLEILTYVLYC